MTPTETRTEIIRCGLGDPIPFPGLVSFLGRQLNEVKDDFRRAERDLSEATKFGKLGRLALSTALTSYFWLDDFLMKPVYELAERSSAGLSSISPATSALIATSAASTALGGVLAGIKSSHIQKTEANRVSNEARSHGSLGFWSSITKTLVVGAPRMVTEFSKARFRLSNPKILGYAAVYGCGQGVTTGPVIDWYDGRLPGEGFSGSFLATAAFVGSAILGIDYVGDLSTYAKNRYDIWRQNRSLTQSVGGTV